LTSQDDRCSILSVESIVLVFKFSVDWDGDCANNTMIWCPWLRAACGIDIVYNDPHVWMSESELISHPSCPLFVWRSGGPKAAQHERIQDRDNKNAGQKGSTFLKYG